jgi:hypothetical protein
MTHGSGDEHQGHVGIEDVILIGSFPLPTSSYNNSQFLCQLAVL